MSTASLLALLASTTRRQLGLFTRADARAVGIADASIRRLVQSGAVERLSRRVFRLSTSTPSWHQQVLAAVLDGGLDCLASHRTAAALHRLDGFEPGGIIDVVVPMHIRHRRLNAIVHHTRDLPRRDRCTVGPIPATTIARTLIDLGGVVPADRVEEAFDAAERDGRVRRGSVERRYAELRAPGRNGIGAMTQIIHDRVPAARVPRSVLERRMRRLLDRAGLPLPLARYRVRLRDGRAVELDFAYVERRLGLEADGHGAHATRRQRAADHRRANALADVGWELRRFTYEQVMYEGREVAATIRTALAQSRNRL